MPRGRGNTGRGGGRGGGRRSGRLSNPRCAPSLSFPISGSGNAEAVPIPGPSIEPSRPNSLIDQLKAYKVVKAMDAKNLAKSSPVKKRCLEELRQQKQVGNFRMPDAPEPKKVKGKGKGKKSKDGEEETQVWGPCPLLCGVPTVPPPHEPQWWELQRSHASTTSTATPGSGRSAHEFDVDIDFKRDFIEPGEGSDVEHEENLENPIDIECLVDPLLIEAIRSIDAEADLALRTVLDPGSDQDLLSFDWRCEPQHFEGAREVFNVPSGPTFENADLTPLEVFLKIWDADLIAHIVRETNRYGAELVEHNQKPNSRLQRWKNVTDDDIKVFFAIIMLQSLVINNVEREYWHPKLDELRIGNFGAIMPYNRFLEIKRCLHFVNNASLPEHPNRLHKIMPIIERLNEKFSSLYLLEQNIAIDESLLLWKGRLSFSKKIATRKAREGIKSYELCELRTGYLWRMEVYSGKGHVHVAQMGSQEPVEEHEKGSESESAISQIVLTLMRPLFNRGHTLVMDSFYNAPLLSRILKVKHKTDSMGTLRLNREFVPEGLRKKAKNNMKAGEVAFSSTKDLSVVLWKDKNVVAMISTYHQVKVGGNYKYKPQVVLDYNLSMGSIDYKNQMLHAYPVERDRNIIWYKKLFRRLLNVTIHNSFVLFNHNRTSFLGHREFRLQLVKELLQTCRPGALPRSLVPASPAAPSQKHLPAKNERPQRCKLCHAAKVRRTTVWRCSTCEVNLCIEGCYTDYHK